MMKFEFENQKTEEKYLELAKNSRLSFYKRKDLGFPFLPERKNLVQSTISLAESFRSRFHTLVIIGIGGSSLGPRVLQEIFETPLSTHKLLFCDNVDSIEFDKLLLQISDFSKTGWVVISKSGTTIESLMSLDLIHQKYQEKNLSLFKQLAIITEKKENPLSVFAEKNNIPSLEIPLDVGGRFSVLTPVGMFPAAFLGLSIEDFMKGAEVAINNHSLIEQIVAKTLSSYQKEEWITFFWFYSSSLKYFGGWLQQLWAESLGKRTDRTGQPAPRASTPFSAIGACDQHSVLQQVMEGTPDKFVIFTRVQTAEARQHLLKESLFPQHNFLKGKALGDLLAAEAQATSKALSEVNVSNCVLKLQNLNPTSVGELFMFWQLVVACLGEALNINAFDQPGVELGKRLAKEILKS